MPQPCLGFATGPCPGTALAVRVVALGPAIASAVASTGISAVYYVVPCSARGVGVRRPSLYRVWLTPWWRVWDPLPFPGAPMLSTLKKKLGRGTPAAATAASPSGMTSPTSVTPSSDVALPKRERRCVAVPPADTWLPVKAVFGGFYSHTGVAFARWWRVVPAWTSQQAVVNH